jgi:hypothetical protein
VGVGVPAGIPNDRPDRNSVDITLPKIQIRPLQEEVAIVFNWYRNKVQ